MAETIEEQLTWPRRVRSFVLLLAMVAALGVAAAGLIGVLIVAGTSLIDQALG